MATSTTSPNLPSLEEAHRVVTFVLDDEARAVAGRVADGAPTDESLREILALTIAVVGAAEHLYRMIGPTYPDQWESMERSATAFTDHHVIAFLAENDPAWKRALTKHRRRKLAARAGALCLVESQLGKRARWSKVTLPDNAPIPISIEVSEGLGELAYELSSASTSTSAPSTRPIRSCSPARSSACSPRPSACSRCSRPTRWPRSAFALLR